MNFFNRSKRKKKPKADVSSGKKEERKDRRKQYNVIIYVYLRAALKEMAKQFRVNPSAITEHLIQVGLYYTIIAMKDEEKRKTIEKHLIDVHLCNQPEVDEEIIITRTVERNLNWMLLKHSKLLLVKLVRLKKEMEQAIRTGDFSLAERAEKELNSAILKFADYLLKHRRDDSSESPGEC